MVLYSGAKICHIEQDGLELNWSPNRDDRQAANAIVEEMLNTNAITQVYDVFGERGLNSSTELANAITEETETTMNRVHLNYKDPISYKQAQKSACADEWEVAVQKELQQLIDFKTCEVIKPEDIPAGKNITGSKIVFKTKLTADGNIEKRKCRIVTLGYSQIYSMV